MSCRNPALKALARMEFSNGLHPTQRYPARESTFDEAAERVRNDFNLDRRVEANAAEQEVMRENYRIRIDR